MKHFALRINERSLFEAIEKLAKQERRSINSQINVLLEKSIKDEVRL